MSEPIVIGVALRDDDEAPLALGADLVRFIGAPPVLAHVFAYDTTTAVSADAEAAALEGVALLALASVAESLGADMEVTLHAEPNSSRARGLQATAEKLDASILVVGASHRGRIGRVVPGGVAERLLHVAPCALAVAPRGYSGAAAGIRRIGVAFADTAEGREALDAAAALAALGGARLSVYTAVDRQTPLPSLPKGVVGDLQLLEGDVGEALAAASGELDLLVCGSRGFGALHGALAGSVSATLAHRSECPLIVLPRDRRSSGARDVPSRRHPVAGTP
jgi:nucleotide-binding universal stress UspA family protein